MPTQITRVGGPASFQRNLTAELRRRKICVAFGPEEFSKDTAAVLIINGTRHVADVLKARAGGSRIVQRLGSPFALKVPGGMPTDQRLRSWAGSILVRLTRRLAASRVVYQSRFVRDAWEAEYGALNTQCCVIYNGVDLQRFSPEGPRYESHADICIISVEGTQVQPEHSAAFRTASELNRRGQAVELVVFGVPSADAANQYAAHPYVRFLGSVPQESLPYYYRGATLYVLNDILSAGCPNSVAEALACGTPVMGYAAGVLPELLRPVAGICVAPTAGVPGERGSGEALALGDAAEKILRNADAFRAGARRLAEEQHDLQKMAERYVEVLFG